MAFETILLEISNGAARLTLNRPDRLNSFNIQMHEEVQAALDEIENNKAVRTLLLTGAGRGFCAGQDLSDRAVAPGSDAVDLGESVEKRYNPLIRRLTSLPMPVVCAVNGVAAGAGTSIAFACDIVLAAKSAKFVMSFANIGLVPDSGGSWALPRLAGQARALGLALTGDPLPAETAADWGLIWKCIEDESLATETDALVKKFASAPTRGLAETKKLIRTAFMRRLDEQLDLERDKMRELGRSDDYREGVDAFMNKRKPEFKGH
ncbi:2-(1,2-epoxy-1,2-dihydrophenyl)acetyl-CoA isomerase PaaG [Hyphococcus flavus]|uniref:2-(1,2-epoxy-1,2-dihydrophenyl)acetyl-CoA isomerase PaaG n=1 Tax=Hyphococcus flavus TaxID=1866326 RepID=A0AAE9ZDU2_9PROT|nr:2-(1,2-epoxy-1,2-dihydrophenyl)acetyl-CoA isomerase PaaG [Hyphococcus flavus]WDI30677.1 2-(1,2-epoxy-1,2-dihydrophenyl)acetyl-CoA isomerase PaaG [Hyphococcus flavus]